MRDEAEIRARIALLELRVEEYDDARKKSRDPRMRDFYRTMRNQNYAQRLELLWVLHPPKGKRGEE